MLVVFPVLGRTVASIQSRLRDQGRWPSEESEMRVTKMHAIEENRALSPSQPDIASSQGHDPGFFSACMNDHSICTGEAAKRQSTAELLGNMAIPDKTPLPPDSVIERPLIGQLTRMNTELVNAQRQLVKKNARLEKVSTQRFQILGMLAHDLRNPLTGILNASDLVLKEASGLLAESDLTLLQAIQSSSRFMLRLIDDMLEISTIESGKLRLDRKLTDILSLIQQNLSLNRRLAEHKQISIDVIASRALPRISIDPHKIYQVMDNLVTNAIKF
jgi:signal transduction histidine kinase